MSECEVEVDTVPAVDTGERDTPEHLDLLETPASTAVQKHTVPPLSED